MTYRRTGQTRLTAPCFALVAAGFVTACASGSSETGPETGETLAYQNAVDPASRDFRMADPGKNAYGTAIDQISNTQEQLTAAQIRPAPDTEQLTVGQLRTYADRCMAGTDLMPPPDLDCSELKLRIDRTFETEDDLADALAVLDRLGRADNADDVARRLNNRKFDQSQDAQAIANGILDPAVPQAEKINADSSGLLETDLQNIDPGIIILTPAN